MTGGLVNDTICTLIFLIKSDQILLAIKKRGFGESLYNGVGGKIEPGETIEQTLLRETNEEITVTPMHYWKVAEHSFVQSADKEPWSINMHVFVCDEWHGEPTETEEMAPEWFDIKDIPYDKMWQDDEYWLPQVLAGKKVVGFFNFDENNKLMTHDVKMVDQLPGETNG